MRRWLKIDLHIHSALSPCALPEMTPNNIVNMAQVLGLDVIAVTDHHAAENVAPVYNLARRKGIICIPGIEVQSKEEVHLLCYFAALEPLLDFSNHILTLLNQQLTIEAGVGQQLIFDEEDRVIGERKPYLHQSIPLSIEEIWYLAEKYEACCLPAHLDRPAFGLLGQLGFIPPGLPVQTVEVTLSRAAELAQGGKYGAVITASDAHSLEQMVTPGHTYLHPSLNSVDSIWHWLKKPEQQLVKTFKSDL
ncbi:MAG: PHP domain-containing protein [Firmicutes bacterium]|nr:PHP domain-containing protein [Bacillota bacterium]